MKNPRSRLGIILNAHLPYVRHIDYPKFLEEDWLFEAMNESYIPLLRMLGRVSSTISGFRICISLSPTLCTMLGDKALNERFVQYMLCHIELGEKEIQRLEGNPAAQALARNYHDGLASNLAFYKDACASSLLSSFQKLEKKGVLEIITTCATHAYLPLYQDYPRAVNAQVEVGLQTLDYCFDEHSRGFWLPECAYYPGLEKILAHQNVEWIPLSSQALLTGSQLPLKGNFAPIKTPSGVYAFSRDLYLSNLIWSDKSGYPSDPDYREFYRDIGYDLDMDYIRPYIHEPGVRVFTGYKYWAVTGHTNEKVLYDPKKAKEKVKEHASNFIYSLRTRADMIRPLIGDDPYFTVSFDAELFGHWWYEGIDFLEELIKAIAKSPDIELQSQGDYVLGHPDAQVMEPGWSSWGEGGFNSVWLDSENNAWLYRHTFKAIENMQELAERFSQQTSLKKRFLSQAARETLLLMASDWPFIIHSNTSAGYAKNRLLSHLENIGLVYNNMCKNAVNTEWLVKAEKANAIFPNIDYNIFSRGVEA